MQVYWSSVFLLPKSLFVNIEQKLRNFLWSGRPNISTKAKDKWENVCAAVVLASLSLLYGTRLDRSNISGTLAREDGGVYGWIGSTLLSLEAIVFGILKPHQYAIGTGKNS